MRLLQVGMAKSGNYWLWNILQKIMTSAGLPKDSFIQNHPIHDIARDWELSFKQQADIDVLDIQYPTCFYRISTIFRMPIQDMDAYLSQCNHIWTHSEYNAMSAELLPKFDKIVLIIRDPRDVLISSAKFNQTDYMQNFFGTYDLDVAKDIRSRLSPFLTKWVKYNYAYLSNLSKYNIHLIFYEQLIYDFHGTVRELCDYLDVSLDDKTIQSIHEGTHFKTLKQQDPAHVRQGQAYKWTKQLDASQELEVAQTAGDFLAGVGYPKGRADIDRIPDAKTINFSKLDTVYQEMLAPGLKARIKAGIIQLVNQF